MKLIAAIVLGLSIALLVTGSFLWGLLVLLIGLVVLFIANRPKQAKDRSVPRDRLGGLDGLFGNE